jgi:hypothetical protein
VAGEITSGSFSPTMQQSIALARLPLAVRSATRFRLRFATSCSLPGWSSLALSETATFSFDFLASKWP